MSSVSFRRLLGIASLCLLGSTTSHAALLTANSSLGNNVYLNQGSVGSFNINGLVNPLGHAAPYAINSASVSFLFSDDGATDLVLASHYTTAYTPAAMTSRLDVSTYTNPGESATVGLGAQSGAGATGAYSVASHLDHVTIDWDYWGNNCNYGYSGPNCWVHFQGSTHYYTAESGHRGDFGISFNLDAANLGLLSTTGVLDFNLGITGDLILKSASLDFDISGNAGPIVPPAGNGVPEPASLALGVLALGGLGCTRRRAGRAPARPAA